MTPRRWIFVSAVLLLAAQAVLTYGLAREDLLPSPPPLALFPASVGGWTMTQDIAVDPDALAMLGPDDILNRVYRLPSGEELTLFFSYYKTQHRSRNAHDPKVCLPGAGWNPTESTVIEIPVAGGGPAIGANRYVITRGGSTAVVIYWFQTHTGGVAKEQSLRLGKLIQTIRDRRTDMALIRIVIPAAGGNTEAAARAAVEFAQSAYPHIARQFADDPFVSAP